MNDPAVDAQDVQLVLDFINTVDAETGVDVLDEESRWAAWLAERRFGHEVAARDARPFRDGLRYAVGDEHATAVAAGMAVRMDLSKGAPRLVGEDVLAAVLAAGYRLAVLGEWSRIKICPAHDCRWAFFDRSRNRSRTWCSMQVCGNREKARTWRERTRVR
ncbi:CGNR zinc finger domain-containing protein [Herbihabitans rhizosphaerae]|uniref:CGNR zinc finger domain-containing protein n=1 Tax=Herbihabitans rhizosphaerae TaxID=1872711 RepID=UPI001F5EC73A|nr:CGNR zinc finger domain-containing protein [Herbihabitans rhizosphaerae]